jgi:ElaA protein
LSQITFHIFSFQQLSATQLYAIMQLRNEVFVVEQNCVYQEADGKDASAMHLCGYDSDNILIAYSRVLPIGISYNNYCSIGRVVVAANARKHNYGKLLMHEAIAYCKANFEARIKISAQQYLLKFYSELGFVAVGESYLEDGIPHIGMLM